MKTELKIRQPDHHAMLFNEKVVCNLTNEEFDAYLQTILTELQKHAKTRRISLPSLVNVLPPQCYEKSGEKTWIL